MLKFHKLVPLLNFLGVQLSNNIATDVTSGWHRGKGTFQEPMVPSRWAGLAFVCAQAPSGRRPVQRGGARAEQRAHGRARAQQDASRTWGLAHVQGRAAARVDGCR